MANDARWQCARQSESGPPLAPEARGCGHIWTAPEHPPPLICPECLNTRTQIRRIRGPAKDRPPLLLP